MIIEVIGMLSVLRGMRSDIDANDRTYKINGKVLAFVIDTVVDERCDYAVAGDANFPETSDVHHVFGELFVDNVPLLGEERVGDAKTGANGSSGIRADGGRSTFCPLTRELLLEQVDAGEEAVQRFMACLDGGSCTEGIMAGEDRVSTKRRMFRGAKEPCVGEFADLTNKLKIKTESADALVYGGREWAGDIIKKKVVKCCIIWLGWDVEGGSAGGEEGEEEEEDVTACHGRGSYRSRAHQPYHFCVAFIRR